VPVRSVVQRAMAAAPTVLGYGPALLPSSVALPWPRSQVPASLVLVTMQLALALSVRAAAADAPRGGLQAAAPALLAVRWPLEYYSIRC